MVEWPGAVVRRRGGRLIVEVKSQQQAESRADLIAKSWDWNSDRVCILNRAGDTLEIVDDDSGAIDLDRLPNLLAIRAREGGETLRPGVRARTQSLKKLIQAAKIPVEDRGTPAAVVHRGRPQGTVLAAGDRWIDASVMANDKSRRRARLRWTRAR